YQVFSHVPLSQPARTRSPHALHQGLRGPHMPILYDTHAQADSSGKCFPLIIATVNLLIHALRSNAPFRADRFLVRNPSLFLLRLCGSDRSIFERFGNRISDTASPQVHFARSLPATSHVPLADMPPY